MPKVRIEIHLTEKETKILDQIANEDGRSRKNLCETEIRKPTIGLKTELINIK